MSGAGQIDPGPTQRRGLAQVGHVYVSIACAHCEHVNYLKTRWLANEGRLEIYAGENVPFHVAADLAAGPRTCPGCHKDFFVTAAAPQFLRLGAIKSEPARRPGAKLWRG